ncbi:alpha-mannosidase [Devosia sp. SL43]|uniref:alpha-mannosidase n=1 Tax=Devosia sp. SL43 TaxID=2806348 RepID=UPI001F2528E9|nr:glycoside hydrolase family 38 C-terminal domain-containing protein [Devosia sp. SL43]UJW84640.1 alpha-mannosidase [Devosia sp. SL43]
MRLYRDRQRSLDQLQSHLEVWAGELAAWEVLRRHPIAQWSVAAPDAPARPIGPGAPWDNRFGIHCFRTTALVDPAQAVGEVELRLDFGGEALVRLIRADGSEITSFGANPRHPRFAPVPSEPFHIEAEVAARSLFGIPQRDPVFVRAELFAFHPEVRALRRRVEIVRDTILTVEDQELARALYEGVELALSGLRLPTATDEVGPRLAGQKWAVDIWERSFEPTDTPAPIGEPALASVRGAIIQLDAALTQLRAAYPKMGKVLATGHAHIDYAWLWPQPETVRKIVRTFSNVNALMAAHPDFTFLQSSSLFYRHIEDENPALLEAVRGWVAEGRWEPIGGMLIECDTNMPSAEAFLRQFLFGQRDFERYFGAISRTAWLPDTFGFTGAMPQIMRHAGIEALVTIKVSWNETNKLPENLFRWRGNDGSEVMTHTFDAYDADGYNMWMTPGALAEVWGKHKGKDLTDTVIATYGWGDGGGGPDPDQIESMALINLMPAIPTVSHGNIQAHLDRIAVDLAGAALPTWSGEMYLEYHRATLTTQGRTKQLNRRAEFGLVAAEALGVIAALEGADTDLPDLADDWVLMLRNQFHDILPGSSIREVYEQTEPELRGIVERTEAIARAKLAALAAARRGSGRLQGLAVANLSGSAKTSWQVVSAQPLPASLAPQAIAGGYAVTSNRPLTPLSIGFVAQANAGGVTASPDGLENDLVRVRLDAHGRVVSLFDKRCGRDLVDGAANRLMVYRNDLPRNFDAWDIEPGFALGGEELLALDSMTVTASGPHLAEITILRTLGSSRIEQRLRLWANSPRLEFVTSIDWHDRRTYLRAEFPVTVLAGEAHFDQAIGTTARATHDNTTWQQAQFESCGHRFASLAETDWGAALLSSDKYGFSAKGNVLTISLIRGPMFPDMLADEGHHDFTYALLPHDGRHWSQAVQAEADLVCDPLRIVHAEADEAYDIAPVGWQGQQMRFHALKPSEDGPDYVLRLSESAGRRGHFGLAMPTDRTATVVDGLEREVRDVHVDRLRPYQLISVKF